MNDINNPKNKETIILYELATSIIDQSIYSSKDQYPIASVYVLPNLFQFREDIFGVVKKNLATYHEIMLSQILELLSFEGMDTSKELYNLVLDELIKRRKDPSLKDSLDLTYSKELAISELTNFNSVKKYILWAEMDIDIEYPIFRGFGFNVYTINDRFYKEYNLSTGKFIYSCYMNEAPVYYITGHNRKPGFLNDHKFYGGLPVQPNKPEFKDDVDKVKYAIDKILSHLEINKTIDRKDISMDVEENLISPDIDDEDRERYIIQIFSYLKKKYL